MQPEAHSILSPAQVALLAQHPELASAFDQYSRDNAELERKNSQLHDRCSRLEAELGNMNNRLMLALRALYSPKSEKCVLNDPQQGTLFDEPEQEVPLPEPETNGQTKNGQKANGRQKKKGKPKRKALDDLLKKLPRETITIEPDGDTSGMTCIGAEKTLVLERVPAHMKVIEYVRPKYVDPGDEDKGVIIGELPPRMVNKGMAGPGLLADVVVGKYADHLPLYRQQQRFRREGVEIAKSTLGGWISQSASHLTPLYNALKQELLSTGYLQADETGIEVQDGDKKGSLHKGFYWVYHSPEQRLLVMEYRKTRARAGPVEFLHGYEGLLQTDGYVAYDIFDADPSVTLYACMAHARRKFFDCKTYEPDKAAHVLKEIRKLYLIERWLRKTGASADVRQQLRQERAGPVLEELKPWLEVNNGLPKSPWAKATQYTLGRWQRLTRYLDEGRVELDNNLVENAIRPLAIGRKNYLFAGSHDASQRGAVVYSLLGTCKFHDVNPMEWLMEVFQRIPTHPAEDIAALLPHHWKRARQAH